MTDQNKPIRSYRLGNKTIVSSQFKSQRPIKVKGFTSLRSYWESIAAKGGETPLSTRQTQEHPRSQTISSPSASTPSVPSTSLTPSISFSPSTSLNSPRSPISSTPSAPLDDDVLIANEQDYEASETTPTGEDEGHSSDQGKVVKKRKLRGKYQKYTTQQLNNMIAHRLNNHKSISEAARLEGVSIRTASTIFSKFLQDPEGRIPTKATHRKRGRKPKLDPEHIKFIVESIEKQPQLSVCEVWEALHNHFDGLDISKTTILKHMHEQYRFTFQWVKSQIESSPIDSEILEERMNWATEWQARAEEFRSHTVFVDETWFSHQKNRGYGWSRKREPASVKPTNKGFIITVMGAISAMGVLGLYVKIPQVSQAPPVSNAPAPVDGDIVNLKNFKQFLAELMDKMDSMDMQGYNIVLDPEHVHKINEIKDMATDRGYKLVYLPRCSSFLNPIERFWSKLETCYDRSVAGEESVVSRVDMASRHVTVEDLGAWVDHSICLFPKCINRELHPQCTCLK